MHQAFTDQPDVSSGGRRRPPARSRKRKGRDLADLRRQISEIERRGSAEGLRSDRGAGCPIGLWDPIGHALADESLATTRPGLHELVADGHGSQPAVWDFGIVLVTSLLHRHRQVDAKPMVLWSRRQKDGSEFGRLYGPGMLDLGLSPEQLIMVAGLLDRRRPCRGAAAGSGIRQAGGTLAAATALAGLPHDGTSSRAYRSGSAVAHALEHLAKDLCRMLDRAGQGASRFSLLIYRVDGDVWRLQVG